MLNVFTFYKIYIASFILLNCDELYRITNHIWSKFFGSECKKTEKYNFDILKQTLLSKEIAFKISFFEKHECYFSMAKGLCEVEFDPPYIYLKQLKARIF